MIILKDHFKSYIIHISIGHLFQKEMDVFSILLDQYLKNEIVDLSPYLIREKPVELELIHGEDISVAYSD